MNDFNVVMNQMKDLWRLDRIPLILQLNTPKISNNYIGEVTGKFTYENYYSLYKECISKKNYQILMQDESVISMYYLFDSAGEIKGYNLSFIPSLNGEITEYDCNISNIFGDVENYLRIDFDIQGYKKIVHEKQHLHIGINVKSKKHDRNIIRFPIAEKIYPWDFIWLVLKLIYHMEDSYDKNFKKNKGKNDSLINVEDQILHLKFGK